MTLRSFFLAAVLFVMAPAARAEVLVFAAASLKEPLDRMAAAFDDVVISYGGSGTLARQVGLGAPVDVVLLANADWMDVLVNDGDVQPQTRADFASNRLVLIGQAGAGPVSLDPIALQSALAEGRLAVGLTAAVPAGIYAKAALQSTGLWESVQDRLAEVDHVRSALAMVIRGQTPLGIVYQTDVRISDAVTIVATFPTESHPQVRYVGGLTTHADSNAGRFFDYVLSAQGQAIMAEAGFLPPVETAP